MPRTRRNLTLIETDEQRGNLSTRLILGRYYAEIVADQSDSLFHWVVQRVGSREVLQLGQETTFASALDHAHYCLEVLAGRDAKTARAAWYDFGERKN